jgi:hypothetical protein
MRQLLDGKVDHLSKAGIFILEELRDAEEQGGGFIGGESFTGVQEQGDFGEEDSTSSRLYRGRIEQTCCHLLAGLTRRCEGSLTLLEDGSPVDPHDGHVSIFVFLAVTHGE